MATEQTRAALQHELKALAEYGATLPELFDHLDGQRRRRDGNSFSEEQYEQLNLYCWALHKGRSRHLALAQTEYGETLEDDIGA